jgi:hypothetical protein
MAESNITMIGATNLQVRTRSGGKASKTRHTVEISGDTLCVSHDPKALGRPVADAIAELFKSRIRDIPAVASAATQRARASAAKALAAGKAWAMKRYAGGKTGAMAPGGTRLFNDSGRLERTIAVGANEEGWIVNVAANRFNPETLDNGGLGALERIYQRLLEFVPELGDAALLMNSIPIRKALAQGVEDSIARASAASEAAIDGAAEAARQKLQAQIQILRSVATLVA